ncbi:MAG: hypothetical protein GC164_06105 [Phycisphaera sp.]|nr:hypothetical protein [Phycisphaera sp.]
MGRSCGQRAVWAVLASIVLAGLCGTTAYGAVVSFFEASQGGSVTVAATSDTLTSGGYQFTYTRDYLFTGGTGQIIGRPVVVNWPTGLHAQYVTTGPNPAKASVTIRRVDGQVFDILSFKAELLANAGAGRAFEVVPKLNGEEPLNDPIQFDCSGSTYNVFTYSHTPNYLGQTTLPLSGYDTYTINLTLDYALLNITVQGAEIAPEPASCTVLLVLLAASLTGRGRRVALSKYATGGLSASA